MQQNYIDDMKANKDQIVEEKQKQFDKNTEVKESREHQVLQYEDHQLELAKEINDKEEVEEKFAKLKDLRATLTEKHKRLTKDLEFFNENHNCPTCLQDIESSHKETMVGERQDQIKEIIEGAQQLKTELDEVTTRLNEVNEIVKEIREIDIERAKLNSSISELTKYNDNLQEEMNSFEQGSVSQSDIDKLKTMKDDCRVIADKRTERKDERTYTNAVKEVLDDTGIKTKIIKQYLPIMNQLINKYLMSMDFYVNFQLDENFSETIKSRFRDTFNYASFSEGEKMRIDLALLFTWRAIAKMKNSTNTNLLILDEIFDSSLDGAGTDEFLSILNTLDNENIFVISHKGDQLQDKFKNSLKFEKVQNFSRIAQ